MAGSGHVVCYVYVILCFFWGGGGGGYTNMWWVGVLMLLVFFRVTSLGRGSLFSNFIRGKPIAVWQEIYASCSLYIICNITRSLCVDNTYIFMSLLILSNLNTLTPS